MVIWIIECLEVKHNKFMAILYEVENVQGLKTPFS